MTYEIIPVDPSPEDLELQAMLKRIEQMVIAACQLPPEVLYEQGLRTIDTPHGTLRYWEHKLFKCPMKS